MKKFTMFACLAFVLVFALSSFAGDLPRVSRGHTTMHGGGVSFEKAGGDTLNLMSTADDPTNTDNNGCEMPGFPTMEPYYRADFEMGTTNGRVETDGSGWTSYDITQPTETHWQVSTYDGFNSPYPSNRAWCGDENIVSCLEGEDPIGGYGNSWNDLLVFRKTVGNPTVSTAVNVTASLQHDSEPMYDYTYLSAKYNDQDFDNLGVWDDVSAGPIDVEGNATWLPADYIGGTDIELYWRFRSDGGWSDEDCSFYGAGACQIDDIVVTITNDGNVDVYTEDFEGASPFDPSNDSWMIDFPNGVGDYARIWRALEDDDPCRTNFTAQVAFIDDGVVVPGTGGSQCINWCYGPGGYIVTPDGGLAGEAEHIHNALESPIMDWPLHARGDCGSPVPDGIITILMSTVTRI